MRSCLGFIVLHALIGLFVIAVGLGVGFLLNWLIPAIDLGSGVVAGVIATGIALYMFSRIMAMSDQFDDPDADVIVESPTRVFISSIESIPARPRRKGRSTGTRRRPETQE